MAYEATAIFLVQTLFNFYLLIIALRLLLGIFKANFHNSITQLTLKLTNIFATPLGRILPTIKGINLAVVALLIIFTVIELIVLSLIATQGAWPNMVGILYWSLGKIGEQLTTILTFAIIIRVLFSWIAPHKISALTEVLFCLTEPLLRPLKRIIPLFGGFDFSPLAAIILLQAVSILLFNPIIRQGMVLAGV